MPGHNLWSWIQGWFPGIPAPPLVPRGQPATSLEEGLPKGRTEQERTGDRAADVSGTEPPRGYTRRPKLPRAAAANTTASRRPTPPNTWAHPWANNHPITCNRHQQPPLLHCRTHLPLMPAYSRNTYRILRATCTGQKQCPAERAPTEFVKLFNMAAISGRGGAGARRVGGGGLQEHWMDGARAAH